MKVFYHLVWATKDRQPLISPRLETRLHQHLREVAIQLGLTVHAVGGVDDHIHMAVTIPPRLPVAEVVRKIKGASSHRINAEFGEGFHWQADYGVDTFSERHLNQVVAYIANQRQHHHAGTVWSVIEEIPDVPVAPGSIRD